MGANVPNFVAGQRPSATDLNAVRDAAFREPSGNIVYADSHGSVHGQTVSPATILYELTAAPELDATFKEYSATARRCTPRPCSVDDNSNVTGTTTAGNGPVRYWTNSSDKEETIWFPAGDRDQNGAPSSAPGPKSGSRVWTTFSHGRRVVLGGASSLAAFEAKTSGGPGESADAWSLKWNASTGDYDDPDYESDPDLTIADVEKCRRWLGYDDSGAGNPGARGFCTSDGAIVSIQQIARMLGGSAQVDGSKNLTGITSLYSMDGGQLPAETTLTASSTPALMVTGWTTNADSDGVFVWDEHNEKYRPIDLPCKTS